MTFTDNIQKRIDRTKTFAEAVSYLTAQNDMNGLEQPVKVTEVAEKMDCSISVAQTWLIRAERGGLIRIGRKRPWTYFPK